MEEWHCLLNYGRLRAKYALQKVCSFNKYCRSKSQFHLVFPPTPDAALRVAAGGDARRPEEGLAGRDEQDLTQEAAHGKDTNA